MQISLAGWSIHRRFLSEQDPLKLIDFPRVAVEEFDIDMVELNSPFFTYRNPESPETSSVAEGYLRDLKKAADDVACTVLSVAVDGHGDLAALDKAERKQAVENHRKWFDICAALGARCFRANSGGRDQADNPDAIAACTESFGELGQIARQYDLLVLMENHWGISQNPEVMVRIVQAVDSPSFRLLADFLNWPPELDKLAALAKIAPYAYATHAKFLSFDQQGESNEIDAGQAMRIFKQGGYSNPFGIEYEGRIDEHEGVLKSKALLHRYAY
jgi:sugar phosphate isomerase/epimerase